MKKLLIFFIPALVCALAACGGEQSQPNKEVQQDVPPEEVVYIKHCKLCHGSKGDLGLSGAANLKISVLTLDEVKQVVVNGRNAMPAWGQQLPPQEIDMVAAYVMTLRK
ncbi:MAG TPA: cytochrome c [Chitinophagales bacterium]|jgi:mono/diheme cytochrome c family protein|nr:cytochrome c [Chitinophagales bacterium]